MGEAEAHPARVLREEDPVGLAVILLLVDDPRLDALGVQLAPEGVDVADGKPATRLLRVPAVDGQPDPYVVPIQDGGRPILRDQREAEALRVIPDGRPDLLHRQGVRIRVTDRADGPEEHALGHRVYSCSRSVQRGASTPLKSL